MEAAQQQKPGEVTKWDASASAAVDEASAVKPSSRMYWMDWLRVFLTVLVLVHHCVCAYSQPNTFWNVQGNAYDTTGVLLNVSFLLSNQSYFMGLFFLLAGYCTPGSFRRKGPWRWMLDRSIRLQVPALFYSIVLNPMIPLLQYIAAGVTGDAGQYFAGYFKAFPIISGPPWFVYMLWWFSVAYLIISLLANSALGRQCKQLSRKCAKVACEGADSQQSGSGSSQPVQELSQAAALKLMTVCIALLVVAIFVSRCATLAAGVPFWSFVSQYHGLVNFMPDLFAQYVFAFSLGIAASSSNALRRLPSSFGWWCLVAGGCWWLYLAVPLSFACASWLLSSVPGAPLIAFVTQSFAVVWSFGLLVVFRDTFNHKPGTLGARVIGAAYAVYIIHPLFVTMFAWALMHVVFPTYAINMIAISPMVVVSSWLVAAAIKAVPGAGHIM